MQVHDFRSDTVTLPTARMMAAVASARLGDAARGDDPTVSALEARAATMLGKDAAIFLPSGGMANLSAVMAHGAHGREVIVEETSHIYNSEGGGIASVAGAVPRPLLGVDGVMEPAEVAAAIRGHSNSALAPTALICVENTHNAAGGMVVPLDNLAALHSLASDAGIPFHLDGARVFNAAAYLHVPVSAIAEHVDSLMVSVCKGLGGPVGAILAGDEAFIARAWRAAKMLGGGMRQAGLLAAPALVALDDPYPVHRRDHALAQTLAAGLAEIDESLVTVEKVHTNIVNCFVDKFADQAGAINDALKARGILANASRAKIRFVTHYEVDEASVEAAVSAFSSVLEELKRAA
jgi:threonine aldolase